MKRLACCLALLLATTFATTAHAQLPSLTVDWTAPGDDGAIGTATLYDMRFSTTRPDTANVTNMATWWSAATVITGLPAPLVSGSAQSTVVTPAGGFKADSTYYFVLRTRDDVGNWSAYSNVAFRPVLDVTPPRTVVDLRLR